MTEPHPISDYERDHAEEIDRERRTLAAALRNLDSAITTIGQTHGRMIAVYDVEIVEGRAAHVFPAAIAQIEVALAALVAHAPDPGE